jgi:hypothetical protein
MSGIFLRHSVMFIGVRIAKNFNSFSHFGCLLKSQTDLRALVASSCKVVSEAGIGRIIITYGVGMESMSEVLQSLTTRTHSHLTFCTRKVFGKYKILLAPHLAYTLDLVPTDVSVCFLNSTICLNSLF